ncbi:putative palmitoyltransferase ZDHHC24 [Vespula maculifrons]|uniref:Palmitoyltransferase n=1 Tax=Vespula maculifrons TaxID=7453 RepID=A0ABD2CV12_VESMC
MSTCNFIMLNIVGNFTYTILCDTSINRTIVPVSTATPKNGWRLCTTCEILAPPRSWHCSTCRTCILKRDHHCIFTGCCIGMLFTGVLCVYHFRLVFSGCVADESNKNRDTYDLGWQQNIKEVLGERWFLTWLIPYMKSKLPHDGITWDTKSTWEINNIKNK